MERCFITGCDDKTEWQLEWFISNFKNHCKTVPLVVFDFGMSARGRATAELYADKVMDLKLEAAKGWFGKPSAMLKSPANMTCWLDTDCQVLQNPESIFNNLEQNRLALVKDHPWSKRRSHMGDWYNTGVVAFSGKPVILKHWKEQCALKNLAGDQEVLYWMIGGDSLRRMTHITPLSHKYNVLRLDQVDDNVPSDVVIMHWTGEKGNDIIRGMMK